MHASDSATIASLVGRESTRSRPGAISEPGYGGKFAPDGSVLQFPGNTIICPIPPQSDAHRQIVAFQDALKAKPFARHFSFLPPSSLHMTVFEGVCVSQAAGKPWPAGTNADMDLSEVTRIMSDRLEPVHLPTNLTVRPRGPFIHSGLGLGVTGVDAPMEAKLRHTREALRDALDLDTPSFETYPFHISLAYLLEWLSPSVAEDVLRTMKIMMVDLIASLPKIELGEPEFCTFESMHHFEPVRTSAPHLVEHAAQA